jgi:hypothetical protein
VSTAWIASAIVDIRARRTSRAGVAGPAVARVRIDPVDARSSRRTGLACTVIDVLTTCRASSRVARHAIAGICRAAVRWIGPARSTRAAGARRARIRPDGWCSIRGGWSAGIRYGLNAGICGGSSHGNCRAAANSGGFASSSNSGTAHAGRSCTRLTRASVDGRRRLIRARAIRHACLPVHGRRIAPRLWRFARRQRWISLRSGLRSITLRIIRTNAKARDADLRTRTLFVELACVDARRGPRIARCHEADEHAHVPVDVDTSRHASAHTLRIRLQSRPTCQRQRALPRRGWRARRGAQLPAERWTPVPIQTRKSAFRLGLFDLPRLESSRPPTSAQPCASPPTPLLHYH